MSNAGYNEEDIKNLAKETLTNWYKLKNISKIEIHNIPVLKDDIVIGVCTGYENGVYHCEIWDKNVEEEIFLINNQLAEIVLR